MRFSILLCLLVLCASQSTAQTEDEDTAVRNAFAQFPSVVTVEADSPQGRPCGGTLVSDRVVLTAAQCVAETESGLSTPSVVLDVLNAHRVNRQPETRRTVEALVHPSFEEENVDGYDIALLRLDLETSPLPPVAIETEAVPFGTKLITIGAAGEAIRIRRSTVVDPVECENEGMAIREDSMVCIAGEVPCIGDEGGPILDEATGNLVAVVSNAVPCVVSASGHMAVATLQSAGVTDWISDSIGDLEYSAFIDDAPPVVAFDDIEEDGFAPGPESDDLEETVALELLDIVG